MTDLAAQPYLKQGAGPPLNMSPESIYRGELPYVWHSLRRLGVRGADLEDLTQEVFLRAFRSFSSYDPGRPLRPWLFAIAYRLAADHRSLARHKIETSAEVETPDASSNPEANLEASRARALIARSLGAVALERRAVFVMAELNEHTMPEIAEALELPLNTAYSRLRLARVEFADEVRRLVAKPVQKGGGDGA